MTHGTVTSLFLLAVANTVLAQELIVKKPPAGPEDTLVIEVVGVEAGPNVAVTWTYPRGAGGWVGTTNDKREVTYKPTAKDTVIIIVCTIEEPGKRKLVLEKSVDVPEAHPPAPGAAPPPAAPAVAAPAQAGAQRPHQPQAAGGVRTLPEGSVVSPALFNEKERVSVQPFGFMADAVPDEKKVRRLRYPPQRIVHTGRLRAAGC